MGGLCGALVSRVWPMLRCYNAGPRRRIDAVCSTPAPAGHVTQAKVEVGLSHGLPRSSKYVQRCDSAKNKGRNKDSAQGRLAHKPRTREWAHEGTGRHKARVVVVADVEVGVALPRI